MIPRPDVTLFHGDCIREMRKIRTNSVDLVLTDPPYGTTACRWDSVVPFEPMWEQIWRILKPEGSCILFSSLVFTGQCIMSQAEFFKYSLVWRKSRVGNFAQAPYRFLSEHEDITVYSKAGCSKNARVRMKFNPQGVRDCLKTCKGKAHSDLRPSTKIQAEYLQTETGYPKSILEFPSENNQYHPTQKPVALLEYLINTFSDPGDTVVDFTMGSGSTGVAAVNTGRKFMGIERDDLYFWIAEDRIFGAMDF